MLATRVFIHNFEPMHLAKSHMLFHPENIIFHENRDDCQCTNIKIPTQSIGTDLAHPHPIPVQ